MFIGVVACLHAVQAQDTDGQTAGGDIGTIGSDRDGSDSGAAIDPADNPVGLPAPLNESAFQALLTNSPFTRALNLSESLVLTGVAQIDGQPVVTVMDRNTRETFVVSTEQTNIQGWRMVELVEDSDPAATQVHLSVNGETITIRYGAAQLDPVASREGRSRPGAAGSERGERGGGERSERRSRGWGNPEAMQRMQAMSDEQRQQMRDFFNSNRDRLRGASAEERERMVNQAMDRVERGNRGGGRR